MLDRVWIVSVVDRTLSLKAGDSDSQQHARRSANPSVAPYMVKVAIRGLIALRIQKPEHRHAKTLSQWYYQVGRVACFLAKCLLYQHRPTWGLDFYIGRCGNVSSRRL